MSAKVREILILSVLMLHSSFIDAQPDCKGYCAPNNVLEYHCNSEERPTSYLLTSYGPCPEGFICPPGFGSCEPEEPATEEPTTEEPATEEPTTEEPTTEEPTTEEPTTEEPTTEEPTTEEPATEEPTTEEPTTEEPTTEEPTTEEPTTSDPTLGELVGYTCAGEGRYPHPTDCHRYIYCNPSGLNRQIQCQNGFAYQPNDQSCRADQTPCDNMDFKCVATGLFANPLNPSKYLWCLKINGVYHVSNYSCPAGKIFDGKNACVVPTLP